MKHLLITMGDPCGIGPEILVKALNQFDTNASIFIYGIKDELRRFNKKKDFSKSIHFVEPPFLKSNIKWTPKKRAQFVLWSLSAAVSDAKKRSQPVLVTGPIDKSIVQSIDPHFTGHTHHLEKLTRSKRAIMLLTNPTVRIALLTEHVELSKVTSMITSKRFLDFGRNLNQAFRQQLGIQKPRFAVLGLNPHNGEMFTKPKEKTVFIPCISKLLKEKVLISGPYPADGFFGSEKKASFDAVISPYHDQGLVAAKYEGIDVATNITLGLPFLRLSPAHGVAYDLFNTGKASPKSLLRALNIAQEGVDYEKN